MPGFRRARRGGFAIARGGIRRSTLWAASGDVVAATGIAAATAVLDQTFNQATLADVVPCTIVRTVGLFSVGTDQVAASEQPLVAMGAAVVSEQALAAGVASLPTPIVEEDSDLWFLYETAVVEFLFGDATGFALTNTVKYFDSRAQRKIQDGQGIVFMVENASATAGAQYWLKFRMLLKLH